MDSHTGVRLLLIIIVALVLFVLIAYYNRNKSRLDSETFSSATAGNIGGGRNRQQRRQELEADLDDDVDMDADITLKGQDGRKKRMSKGDTGRYLINEGKGQYAPAEFQSATRAKTLEAAEKKGGDSPVTGGVAPYEPVTDEVFRPVDASETSPAGSATVQDAYPGERLKIEDLLPKDAANTTWAMVNPAGQGDVQDQNFVTAGYHIGLNTVGQTNKNPNMQLRSEPPNPRHNTGIWNQSTIEPDAFRRPFELGGV